jgi:hypothetical protein
MYEAGFSSKEVQAWTSGYNEGLIDEMNEWLRPSSGEQPQATLGGSAV